MATATQVAPARDATAHVRTRSAAAQELALSMGWPPPKHRRGHWDSAILFALPGTWCRLGWLR